MAKYTYKNEPISEDFVTEAAEVGGLNIEEYITSKDGLEVVDESIVKNSPTSLDADVEVTAASVTNGESPQANGSSVSLDPDPKKKKADNSKEAILKRKAERRKTKRDDDLLDSIRTSVDENGDFINAEALDEVVVTGGGSARETEIATELGWSAFSANTVEGRRNQLQKLVSYTQTQPGIELAELDTFNARLNEKNTPGQTGLGPTGDQINTFFTGGNDFREDENTWKGDFAKEIFGGFAGVEENFSQEGNGGLFLDFSGEGYDGDANLIPVNMSAVRTIFINEQTTQLLKNQLKRKTLPNLVDETIERGKDFLNESDNELMKLQAQHASLPEGSAERLQVAEEINTLVERENYGDKLYDPFTGKVYNFEQAPQEVLNIYGKAKNVARNTPLKDLKNSLNKAYYKVVALSKGIENYSKDELEAAVPGIQNIAGGIANFFGSTTTLEADYNFINEIAQKEYIPKQITKLPGKHPFALEFNKALEDYVVLNRAYQVNRNPITSEKEGFAMAAWDSVVQRSGGTSMTTGVTSAQEEVKVFSDVMQASGLVDLKPEVLSERLSTSIPQMIGGGFVDLSLFAGEIFATRKLTFNSFKKGTDAIQKMVAATSAYKKSKIIKNSTPIVLKGFEEAGTFGASAYIMGRDPSAEENMATAKFAFLLGTGQGGAALLLKKMPVNTFMSPITAQLAKARTTKNWIPSVTGAGVGAFSFEFASAATDHQEYFKQTPQEMLYHFLGEYGKMRLLGAKSIFSKNGMVRAATNDVREMVGMSTTQVRNAGKAVGWKDMDQIENPDFFTTEYLSQEKGKKIEDVNKKIQDKEITKEEGLKEISELESNYKVLEAQAELNIAKETIKQEDKSGLQPKDSQIYVALEKLKLGQELNAEDNYVLAETPLPLLLNRFAGDASTPSQPTLDYLRSISERSQIIEDILNKNYALKARSGTKLRQESFNFVFDSFDVGQKLVELDNKKNKTDLEETELKELRKEHERYQPKGDLYENITSKIKENRFKVYDENIKESQEFLDAGKEGAIIEIETTKDFQAEYESTVGGNKNVEKSQGFFDPSTNTMYINKARNIETGETATVKHEIDHFALRNSLKNEKGLVTEEGIEIIDDVISRLTPKQRTTVEDRIGPAYKFNEDGVEKNKNEYYEEYLTVLSESIRNKEIQFSKNFGDGLTKLIPLLDRKVEMNAETGENLFNMIKDYAGGGKKGAEAMQKLSKEAEGKEIGDKVVESRTEDLLEGIKEGLYTNETLVDLINSKSKDTTDKFAAIDAIIEENWPVISKALGFNPTGQISMENIKGAIREQMQGIFPNKGGKRKPEFFKDYIPPGKKRINKAGDEVEGTKVTTFLNRFRERTPEILERAKALQAGETKLEGESLDSGEAKQVAAPKPVNLKPAVEPTLDVFSIIKKIKGKNKTNEDVEVFAEDYKTAVEALAKEKGIDITKENLTPKEIKQITPYEILAQEVGIPVNKLSTPRDNLSKPESMRAQQLLLDSRAYIKNVVLGQANREVTTETKQPTKTNPKGLQVKRGGESLGLGTKLVQTFFNPKKRVGNNYVRTPKLFDNKVFDAAIGTKSGGVDKNYEPQSSESQVIKALLKAVAEQMTTKAAVNVIDAKEGKGEIATDAAATSRGNLQRGKNPIVFAETAKTSGQKQLDDISGVLKGSKQENNRERKRILVDELPKYFPIKQILRPTNFTSGTAMSSIEKRGFNVLSNINKITDSKLKKEAEEKLANETLLDLNVIINEAITKGNEKDFTEAEITAFKEAVRGKKGINYKNNATKQELHNEGVKQIINSFVDMIQKGGPSALVVAREMLYHPSLNANFNRNMATAIGREFGVEDGKGTSTDEHVYNAIENAKALLKIATLKNKTIRDNSKKYYADWLPENYIQFTLKNKSDIIKGNLTDADGNVWTNSGGTSHPLLIERLNKAIESGKKEDWDRVPSSLLRYFSEFAHLNPNNLFIAKNVNGKIINETISKKFNVEVPKSFQQNLNVVAEQARLIKEQILSSAGGENKITSKQAQARINEYVKLAGSVTKAETVNNKNLPKVISFSKTKENKKVLDEMENLDKAFRNARNPKAPTKGISVWDFDDTLATTKSNVLYELPNGKKGTLSATDFAKRSAELENKGAIFDFSEFNEITKGKKGPMFEKALNRNKKFGNSNVFILTARPGAAAKPIHDFLKALGLDIPLKNIVGLEDGAPSAKARWVVGKASEGFNDFYFADDAYKNVKAVQDALSVLDVKSKSRQAFVKFSDSKDLSQAFNSIIENKTGIGAEKEYGRAKAEVAGAGKGKFKFFVPPSAEDFVGLLYPTLGKGKVGDAQMGWYKKHLLDPYARGSRDISNARVSTMNNYRALKKQLKIVPKDLLKKIPGEPFTKEQAVRVYIWNREGSNIPGLSKTDSAELTKYVEDNAQLKVFADELINIQKGEKYATPRDSWLAGGITNDILQTLDTTTRSKYLEEWQRNSDAIFTEKNLNKLEAAYGKDYREALENMVERMKAGSNRNFKGDTLTGKAVDWLTGSIGAIMFFNTRSAVLQTISAVNFVNFTDNNILAAGKAFANQPQFWRDFKTLMNSDFLVDRRRGLRLNVNESDIAKAAQKDGVQGAINKLLELGFLPTQIADSFAIASGGSTFYRNRIGTYKKQGFSTKESEEKAMQDWRETSEESQQSSRADRISMQQAGPLGRVVLAFANTPMQYTRLIKKAALDLKDGRGDAKTNISKIIYYGMVQNFIFNSLQQALFAVSLGDDDEEVKNTKKEEKYYSIANSMADSILRGTGIGGSILSVIKNSVIKMNKESKKKNPKFEKLAATLLQVSPPVSSKYNKITNAAKSYSWNKDEMINGGWSLDNPAWLAGGNVISATTNIPLDRLVKKVTNVKDALGQDLEMWERIALMGGWQDWELGIDEEKKFTGGFKQAKFSSSNFKQATFK